MVLGSLACPKLPGGQCQEVSLDDRKKKKNQSMQVQADKKRESAADKLVEVSNYHVSYSCYVLGACSCCSLYILLIQGIK
jgi:ferredoxin